MKGILIALSVVLAATTAFAGPKRPAGDGGADVGRRIRMSVSDLTANFNRSSEQLVEGDLYNSYPKIGNYPVNSLCKEDGGATIRTISPVRGICLAGESCDDDGVPAGRHTAYLTVPTAEAVATCTDVTDMGDGASLCSHYEFSAAPAFFDVPEEVLLSSGADDQEFRPTGNRSTYAIQPCSGR
jgi:hypothetical protein